MNKYQIRLQDRIQKKLLRQLPNFDWKTDFYSNDYLGFARNKQLIERIKIESSQYCTKQIGATGSRFCLLYTSPSPRDQRGSRMPSSA